MADTNIGVLTTNLGVLITLSVATALTLTAVCNIGGACSERDSERIFYHGTTALDALEMVETQQVNVDRIIARQNRPFVSLDLGIGFYMTETLALAESFAAIDALIAPGEGGPAVIRIEIRESRWRILRRLGAIDSAPLTRIIGTQAFVPSYLIGLFNILKSRLLTVNLN